MQEEQDFEALGFVEIPENEMEDRARSFFEEMRSRRSVRHFSDKPVPVSVIEDCLRVAGSAPSGANMQPWHFVVITEPSLKSQIRKAAEQEETAFYGYRASHEWLQALRPFGTNARKPFLEQAPVLIAIFAQSYHLSPEGEKVQHYYVTESVGIATGFLIAALHHAGLACLTHTPSPMRFLSEILERPDYERPFLLLVVGYPAPDATVPQLSKKSIGEYSSFV